MPTKLSRPAKTSLSRSITSGRSGFSSAFTIPGSMKTSRKASRFREGHATATDRFGSTELIEYIFNQYEMK